MVMNRILFWIGLLGLGLIVNHPPVWSQSAAVLDEPATVATEPGEFQITIGAWNIEWLGFPEMRARPGKNRPQNPKDLAAYIHSGNVDVLAIEEIGVDSSVPPLKSSEFEAVLKVMKDAYDQDWEYVLFPKAEYPPDTEDFIVRGQHIGLAWRTDKATLVDEPYKIPVGSNEKFGIKFWERRANAVKLSFGEGKTDVVFIPVHLKSNRNETDDPLHTRKHRLAEAEALIAQLDDLKKHFQDEDIVIMGDVNFLADDDDAADALIAAGFVDLNAADEGTTANWGDGYSSAPFDRIFIPQGQPEFKVSKQIIHRPGSVTDDEIRDYRAKHSDHYMITTVITIMEDDD